MEEKVITNRKTHRRTKQYVCKYCDYYTQLKGDYTKHCKTKKHQKKSCSKLKVEENEQTIIDYKRRMIDLKSELYDLKNTNKFLEEDNNRLERKNRKLFKEMCRFRKELNLRKAGLE